MSDRDLLNQVLKDFQLESKEYLLGECDEQQSVPMTMLLVREAWQFIQKPGATDWLDATIKELESRMGRDDLYALRFLPEKPDLLAAVKSVKDSNVDVAAVSHIIREAQKDVLYGIFSLLDGGHCFDDSLESNWGVFELDDGLEPKRPLMMFQGVAHEFDPDPNSDT